MQDNNHLNTVSAEGFRHDFAMIANWIAPGTKVLDLGCGDGQLLNYLGQSLSIVGYGIEKDDANWLKSMTLGMNVIQMDLEDGLHGFEDQSFDTVVLSQTLQAVNNTEGIVNEMLRVGREVIVTFPNFGFWRNRLQNLMGKMPISKDLPYQWFDTPNVHLCTTKDFEQFCEDGNIKIKERLILRGQKPVTFQPNLFGSLAMYRLGR